MKKVLGLTLALALSLTGCSGYQTALVAYNVSANVLTLAQNEVPALQAAGVLTPIEATATQGYISFAEQLNAQYNSCITNAQQTMVKNSGKFLACATIFANGLANPTELASLRILNPAAQKHVQLWIVAVVTAINGVEIALGGMSNAPPQISASAPAPSKAELHQLAIQTHTTQYGY